MVVCFPLVYFNGVPEINGYYVGPEVGDGLYLVVGAMADKGFSGCSGVLVCPGRYVGF